MWYIISALLIWASSFVAAKFAYAGFDPVLTVQLRLLISAVLVSPFFIRSYKNLPKHLVKPVWLLAFANFPLVLLLQFVGLSYTSASSAVTLVAFEPMMFLILNHLFFAQKAKWFDWALCVVAMIGIVLTVTGESDFANVSLIGSVLVLSAGLVFALCTLFGKDVISQIDAKSYTSLTLGLGAVLCLPMTLIFTKNWQIVPTFSSVAGVLYLGVCCSWLAYWLWNKGITLCHANTAGILIALEPVFGVLLAVLILGERLTPVMFVGCVMVIGAVVLQAVLPMIKKG